MGAESDASDGGGRTPLQLAEAAATRAQQLEEAVSKAARAGAAVAAGAAEAARRASLYAVLLVLMGTEHAQAPGRPSQALNTLRVAPHGPLRSLTAPYRRASPPRAGSSRRSQPPRWPRRSGMPRR